MRNWLALYSCNSLSQHKLHEGCGVEITSSRYHLTKYTKLMSQSKDYNHKLEAFQYAIKQVP